MRLLPLLLTYLLPLANSHLVGEPVASVYDPLLGKRNFEIAAATYCSNLAEWNCVHCVPNIEVYDTIIGDTNIAILGDKEQNATVFAFRGSSDIANWISNFEVLFTEPYADKSIKVHKGLHAEYMSYKDILVQYLDKNENIVITGHSSGAAVGTFFAYDIYKTHKVKVFSYGKPRIGNDAFALSASQIEHYRITHANDIVPHIPEEVLGYRHTNTEVWYPNDDGQQFRVCTDNEDKSCSNSCAPLRCVSVEDHLHYMGEGIGMTAC